MLSFYLLYQKLTDPEWDILRGVFSNQELKTLEKKQFKRALSNARNPAFKKMFEEEMITASAGITR